MDLLKSLNIDELPEQQTRSSHLLQDHPEFDLQLGFDSCCYCGKKNPKVECPSCRRVKYCSRECRQKDATPVDANNDNDENEEPALGHTSVICSLLNLCNDDEAMEGQETAVEISKLDPERRNAALDRQVSEFESYPATLANVIMEAPPYQDTLKKCSGLGLTIHVIGASEDSELWKGHPDAIQAKQVLRGYADALAEISEQYKLSWIRLHFFGPDLPTQTIDQTVPIPPVQAKTSSAKLLVRTFRNHYRIDQGQNAVATSKPTTAVAVTSLPDIAVFFNPGFTCTDYDWDESLSFLKIHPTPFLVATNTEMESLADIQYLRERQLFLDIPAGLKALLSRGEEEDTGGEAYNDDDDDDNDDTETTESRSFFSVNPYAGLRVRQSGTMANDLYVKSRWIFGGITANAPTTITTTTTTTNKSKREASVTTVTAVVEGRKKRRTKGSSNSKASNPALI
jgi:hypothetical protein